MRLLRPYLQLMRLDKPIGAMLLLWPTLWGQWFAANDVPSLRLSVLFILGVLVTRAAGCIINDFADRNFDGHVERTKNRPLVTKAVSLHAAWLLFVVLMLIALAIAWMIGNQAVLWLTLPAALLTIIYPFTKRFFSIPQIWLGFAFSFPILMVFAAELDTVPIAAWFLFAVNFFWVMAFDTIYALTDAEDDAKLDVFTAALTFGDFSHSVVAISFAVFLIGMAAAGWFNGLNLIYYLLLTAAGVYAYYLMHLIKGKARASYFLAFRLNNVFGLIVYLAVVIGFLTR